MVTAPRYVKTPCSRSEIGVQGTMGKQGMGAREGGAVLHTTPTGAWVARCGWDSREAEPE